MQTISCRLVKVVPEETRNEAKKKYNVLQVLIGDQGLKNKLSGEVVSSLLATMDGRECQAVRIIGNGSKYMRIYKVVDFDLTRKYPIGKKVDVVTLPAVKIKDGAPVVIYTAIDDQSIHKSDVSGEAYLLPIKDYVVKTNYQPGDVTIPVSISPWGPSESGRYGLNYKVEE